MAEKGSGTTFATFCANSDGRIAINRDRVKTKHENIRTALRLWCIQNVNHIYSTEHEITIDDCFCQQDGRR